MDVRVKRDSEENLQMIRRVLYVMQVQTSQQRLRRFEVRTAAAEFWTFHWGVVETPDRRMLELCVI